MGKGDGTLLLWGKDAIISRYEKGRLSKMKQTSRFEGFEKDLTDFLWELRFNNYKQWFDENRSRYQRVLKEPMDALAEELVAQMKERYQEEFLVSVSRINRDVRFSKDKSPYRDHKWLVLKRGQGLWKDKPVLFFEVGPDYYMVGLGIYERLPAYMKAFRKKVEVNPAGFLRLAERTKAHPFTVRGEDYKKKMGDWTDPTLGWWMQKKEISFIEECSIDERLYSRALLEWCLEAFGALLPMCKWMEDIVVE